IEACPTLSTELGLHRIDMPAGIARTWQRLAALLAKLADLRHNCVAGRALHRRRSRLMLSSLAHSSVPGRCREHIARELSSVGIRKEVCFQARPKPAALTIDVGSWHELPVRCAAAISVRFLRRFCR